MMKYIKHLFIALLFATAGLAPASLSAQKNYLDQIKASKTSVDPVGTTRDRAKLQMTLSLEELKIRSNDRLILTPILRDKKSQELLFIFPRIEVMGRKRAIIESRYDKENDLIAGDSIYTTVRRENGTAQVVDYSYPFTYTTAMKGAELLLAQQVYGCSDCFLFEGAIPLMSDLGVVFYEPQYRVSYIVPPVEPVKERADRHTATLNFRVDKSTLDPSYGDNRAILSDVRKVMDEVMGDENITITSLTVAGYASPEATVAYNKRLSERRAQAFSDYLSERFGIAKKQMRVEAPGEDWVKTRELVAGSDHPDQAKILQIIDQTNNPDARDAKLKQLSGGETYRWMLHEIYPQVRRVEYTIAYQVRAFDVEEAREIIKSNPKLLSLNEMYLVAMSYPLESKEFKEVFDIATRLYPNDPVAIVNASAVDIEGGNYQAAIDRLARLQPEQLGPEALNNLGVAYIRMGDTQKAQEYFRQVAERSPEATHNLQEIEKIEKQ